jgi:hypothetical protein
VGVTGTMVMVLDFPRPPRVMDYDELLKSNGWSGYVLTPMSLRRKLAPWLVAASGLVMASVAIGLSMRQRAWRLHKK